MASAQGSRVFTLLQREFREYKNSLFWAPIATAIVLGLLMLGSVVLANRISVISDVLLESVMKDQRGVNISISMGDDDELPTYEVTVEDNAPAEQWNFSREWRFDPDADGDDDAADDESADDMSGRELNPMLNVVNGILMLVLLLTTFNYLLSSLYDDRKDRSILFWRSLPVSEWEIVLSKFVMALVVAPLLFIAISMVLQFAYVLLMMLLVWRMGEDAFETVIANIDFFALVGDPIGGWVLTALWIAPLYAYLLLASSAAKRSPFMTAIVPLLALMVAEGVFFGSENVRNALQNHFPHVADDSAVGFYLFGPVWDGIDLVSMGAGLVFTTLALTGAVYLRRYRWEL